MKKFIESFFGSWVKLDPNSLPVLLKKQIIRNG